MSGESEGTSGKAATNNSPSPASRPANGGPQTIPPRPPRAPPPSRTQPTSINVTLMSILSHLSDPRLLNLLGNPSAVVGMPRHMALTDQQLSKMGTSSWSSSWGKSTWRRSCRRLRWKPCPTKTPRRQQPWRPRWSRGLYIVDIVDIDSVDIVDMCDITACGVMTPSAYFIQVLRLSRVSTLEWGLVMGLATQW